MNKIKIMDGDEFLSFDLVDILKCIRDRSIIYNWAITDLYCTSKHESNLNAKDLEEQVNSKENLFVIDFNSLMILSTKINQTIDGKFIASKTNFPKILPDSSKLEESFDIIIEAIDSSYWTVYSKDLIIIKLLMGKFKNTKVVY